MKTKVKILLLVMVLTLAIGATMIMSVASSSTAEVEYTQPGGTTVQTTFSAAIATATTKGGTIKLLRDVTGAGFAPGADGVNLTIDVGSYTLDYSALASHAFTVQKNNVNITVKGTGKVIVPNTHSKGYGLFYNHETLATGFSFNLLGEDNDRLDLVVKGHTNTFDHRLGVLNVTNVDMTVEGYSTFFYNTAKNSGIAANFTDSSITVKAAGANYPFNLTTASNTVTLNGVVINNSASKAFFAIGQTTSNVILENTVINSPSVICAGKGAVTVKDGVAVTKSGWDANAIEVTEKLPEGYVAAYIDAGKTVEFVAPENAVEVTYLYNGQELGSRLTKIGTAPAWGAQGLDYVYESGVLYSKKGAFYSDEELTVAASVITEDTATIYMTAEKSDPYVWAAFSGEPSADNVVAASTDSNEIISAVKNTSVTYIQGYENLSLTYTARYDLTRNLTIDATKHDLVLNGAASDYTITPANNVTLVIKNATISSETVKLAYPLNTTDSCNIKLENLVINWTNIAMFDYRSGGTFTAKDCVFNFNAAGISHAFYLYNNTSNKTLDMSFVDCTVNMAQGATVKNAFVHVGATASNANVTVNVKGCSFNLTSDSMHGVFYNESASSTFKVNVDANELVSEKGNSSFASGTTWFKATSTNSANSSFTLGNGVAFESPIDSTNVKNVTPVYPAGAVFARQNNAKYPYVLTDNYVTVNVVLNGNTTPTLFVNGYTGEPGSEADNSYMLVTVEDALRVARCKTAWFDENDAPIAEFVAKDGMTVIGKSVPTDVYAAWEVLNADQTKIVLCSFDQGCTDEVIHKSATSSMSDGDILRLHKDLSYAIGGSSVGSVTLPKNAVIDLNGNKLTMVDFRFNMSSEEDHGYTIKNGTLDCTSTKNNIVYANTLVKGRVDIEDVTLVTGAAVFDIRGGNLNLTNCRYTGTQYFLYTASKPKDAPISINVNGGNYSTTNDFIRLEGASAATPYLAEVDIRISGDTVIECGLLIDLFGNYSPDSTIDISFTGAKIRSTANKLISSDIDTNFNLYFGEGCKLTHDPADIKGSYAPDSIATPGGLAVIPKANSEYAYIVGVPVIIRWNLTLYTDFDVNLYIKADGINYVKINGVAQNLTNDNLYGGDYVFTMKSIAANLAAEKFTVEVGYGDGYSVSMAKSVVDYAKALLASINTDLSKNLIAAAMQYVGKAYDYANSENAESPDMPKALTDLLASESYLAYLPEDVILENNTDEGNSDLAIKDAQFNLSSQLKFRFNLNPNYTGTLNIYGQSFNVSQGLDRATGLSYIELNIRAFALYRDTIDISGTREDGTALSGTYSLGAYVAGVKDKSTDETKALLSALSTYVATASEYKYEWDLLDQFTYEKNGNTYIITGAKNLSGDVVIPEARDGVYIAEIAAYAFAGNTEITSVVLPSTIRTIGIGAFKGCTALKSVKITDTVTAIGARAFEDTGLTEVVIPDSVEAIGHGAFKGCNELVSITLPFVGANLSDSNNYFGYIFGAFSYVGNVDYVPESLTTVILSDACTDVPAYAFVGCKSITSITIGSGVKRIGTSAFQSCTGLKTIYIPATVTEILAKGFYYNSPFIGCSSELTIYTEADDLSAFGTYWRNLTSNSVAEVVSGISYGDYLLAIAD